jgi:hypothetical protein
VITVVRIKEATLFRTTVSIVAAALLAVPPQAVLAQTQLQASPPAQPASAPSQDLLNAQQLDALLSPIALYPDALLAEVLMASTYPLEVVEADRWAKDNKSLKGDKLKEAIEKQSWDKSVKSLAATPSVLDTMSSKIDWTQKLGNAVLAQQADVMDAIQRLREKAEANKKLASTKEQKVTTQQDNGKTVIIIEPADPNTVYVPYYDPAVVYGPWPYPAYPPYYWPAPGYIAGGIIATGIAFGAGYALGRWASGGYWGGGFGWGNNNININRNVNIGNVNINRGSGNVWTHNPAHRQGVRYDNANVAAKFGGRDNLGGAQDRLNFRGREGQQVLKPGGGQGNLGNLGSNRPGGGAGPGAGTRPGGGNRPSARPSGGDAFGNISQGGMARAESMRGRESFGGGGFRGGGGGGFRGGGERGGGGRRSDISLKHDIVLLGRLDDGLGFYRFTYNGGHTVYVGVMAQEVQVVMPGAVERGADGYLRVHYEKLGVTFETYEDWLAAGAKIPVVHPNTH